MLHFVNNWITPITAALSVDDTVLQIGDAARDTIFDNQYFLTLTQSLDPLEGAPVEIVLADNSNGVITLTRGQDGTQARAWPVGTLVYCSITAQTMNAFYYTISDLTARIAALESGNSGGEQPGGPV